MGNMTQDQKDDHMLKVRHALFNHKRNLQRLQGEEEGLNPFEYSYPDEATERAAKCAQLHINIFQGEYFSNEYHEMFRREGY